MVIFFTSNYSNLNQRIELTSRRHSLAYQRVMGEITYGAEERNQSSGFLSRPCSNSA